MSTAYAVFSEGTSSGVQALPEEMRGSRFDLVRVGRLLKQARERKELSVGDVSEALFLTKSTLEAMESGHWEILPHPVYVRGYAKSYACYLSVYERIEEFLHRSPEPLSVRSHTDTLDLRQGEEGRRPGGHRAPLRSLALLCSSVVGFAFGTTASTAFVTTPFTALNDVLVALQVAAISLRKLVVI